jgi:hypothetical protein
LMEFMTGLWIGGTVGALMMALMFFAREAD